MKKIHLAFSLMVSSLLISCSEKKESHADQYVAKDSVMSLSDSAAIKAKRKKVQEQEKAKLDKPYREDENAEEKIEALIKQAKVENKNIILQAGGNWCIWCLRFNDFVQKTPELKKLTDDHFLYYHLNYSPKNKNEKVFNRYGNPGEKYGYPVFIVLDKNGKLIHTQDSAVLEDGNGYDLEKVKTFFTQWIPN